MKRSIELFISIIMLFVASSAWSIQPSAGGSPNGGTFDTSFAIEYSYSCLSGGCHETNATLVNEHAQSYMTHTMVKCNACHGTHTAAEVGQEKPNLTGYFPGIGPTGYTVGRDRCLVCHSAIENAGRHPHRPSECVSCHAPHIFPAKN